MGQAVFTTETGAQAPASRAQMLAAVKAVTEAHIKPMAPMVDKQGIYPADAMRMLGEAGAFAQHLAGFGYSRDRDLLGAVQAMAVAGTECGCTSFLMWLQDAFGWYLELTENAGLRAQLQGSAAAGAILGTSGMSNPVKSLDEIEDFKLRGERVEGGYVVSGVLPYVSNLGHGHYMGTAFALAADPRHRVMCVLKVDGESVKIAQNTHFVALEGSGTYTVIVKKAFVPDAMILADPVEPLMKRLRPVFMLTQGGMALGQIQGCINIMRDADKSVGHVNQYLPDRPDFFEDEAGRLGETVARLLETPTETSPDFTRQVLQARLDAGELTMRAAHAAVLHAGAKGYIVDAAADRRLRESIFVAIVTPATKHLRQQLAKMSAC